MMRFADQRAQFNRRFFNRVMRPLSGRVAMWSIIEHRGRRSGDVYRTPVSMFPTPDGIAIRLALRRGSATGYATCRPRAVAGPR